MTPSLTGNLKTVKVCRDDINVIINIVLLPYKRLSDLILLGTALQAGVFSTSIQFIESGLVYTWEY